MYQERMIGYYPQVIQTITEFKGIVDSEYPEFNLLGDSTERVIDDAYLSTMSLERILQWESLLGIMPLEGSTEDDRRDVIMARIRGQGKLNTALINSIVKTFTGGTAKSWVANSTLYVEITPPPENKQYQFINVERELKQKVPAHLNFQVSRNYYTWGDIKDNYSTWQDVYDEFDNWETVLLFTPFE